MIFRSFEKGDEEGIVNFMNRSISGFHDWGLTPEK
jgi:hypothetical protein